MTDDPIDALAVRNPANPRHFMRMKPVKARVEIRLGGALLAASSDALRVLEAGRDLYDPVLYLPAADVTAPLRPTGARTRCPIKGGSDYLDLLDDAGAVSAPRIGWRYDETVPGAEPLLGRIAFDAARVSICETPL